MFCPKCSTEASTAQKFCRACGMELLAVAELVQSDNPSQKQDRESESGFTKRHRAMMIWGCVTMFGAVALGASLKILGKEGIRPAGEFTPYLSVLAILTVFFAMGMMCLAFLEAAAPRRGSKKREREKVGSTQLEQLSDQPSSITEKTTEFFEDAPAPMRVRDTAPHGE